MSGGEVLVAASEVSHSFGEGALRKEILHRVTCEVHAREIVIVTGPSGSGPAAPGEPPCPTAGRSLASVRMASWSAAVKRAAADCCQRRNSSSS